MTSSLEQALDYWRRGLSVIPVPRPIAGAVSGQPGDGKVPSIAWKDFQAHLPTERQMLMYFDGDPVNVAIVTGAVSGIVVVDCDSAEALRYWTARYPYTPWQTQTSRDRFHLYYRHSGVRVPNKARIHTAQGRIALDVRGDGGYVIAAPSVHASGAIYERAGDWTVSRAELPRFWAGWLERPTTTSRPRPTSARPTTEGDVIGRARRYLAAVPLPDIGAGSDAATLYAACRLVRGFGLSASDAVDLLWTWAGNRPGWTHEWITQKVAHAERYGTEPIGALR